MKKLDFNSAYNYATLLLKYRDRSESEIISRLEKRGYSKQLIEEVVLKLKEFKFLDDEKFIRSYIEKNLQKGKSFNLILYEIKKKYNITPSESVLSEFRQKYSESKFETIIPILVKKFEKKIYLPNYMNKLQNFLLRKGYGYEDIREITQLFLSKIKKENNYD